MTCRFGHSSDFHTKSRSFIDVLQLHDIKIAIETDHSVQGVILQADNVPPVVYFAEENEQIYCCVSAQVCTV